jgi:carbon storage regulator CsrA
MLVLSRKQNEKILFPTLGITLEILGVQGRTARIGIEAPEEVPIYRHEVAAQKSIAFTSDEDLRTAIDRLARTIRDRLDTSAACLNELHRHLESLADDLGQMFVLDLFKELKALDASVKEVVQDEASTAVSALLVESDPNERLLLAGYLRVSGIETTTANDNEDALNFLSLHAAPDIILMDMNSARCTGPFLVNAIRSSQNSQPQKLFAVSELDPCDFGIRTGPDGIDRWFPKPVDPEQLVVEISHELGGPSIAV